jgi:8-oxo-dGTP pyrophosphatase MutT (NUDIX family)
MHEIDAAERPRVTVAAVVERDGRFLLVRERAQNGDLVINQPAGHLEAGESLVEAVIRETREETGWKFVPKALVGVYLWQHPTEIKGFVRFALSGAVTHRDENPRLDEGIEEVLWLSAEELKAQAHSLRSPLVMRGICDYLNGERFPLTVLKSVV